MNIVGWKRCPIRIYGAGPIAESWMPVFLERFFVTLPRVGRRPVMWFFWFLILCYFAESVMRWRH